MKYLILLTALLGMHRISAQGDTLTELDLTHFLQHVKENHPVALVASNSVEQAAKVIVLSKGAFDPVVFGGIDQKIYAGTTYYSTLSTGVKIPTRLGIDLKVMGDWNRGTYLNPERKVPENGLSYIGVEVPIGRGLFTDERRTQLKRAVVAHQQSAVERNLALNDLLYEAGQQFINWQEQVAQLILAEEGLQIAEERYAQLKISAASGDRASIDTVEASAQLFLRKMEVEQRILNAKNARISVENYLWEKGTMPLDLGENVSPTPLIAKVPSSLLIDSTAHHPAVNWYALKLTDLQLERKWKIEQLKPQLTVHYNLLQTPSELISTNYSFANYKWGASFYMPILLRKERSSLAVTNLKLESAQMELELKQRSLRTKQIQTRNEWNTVVTQAEMSLTISNNYKALAEAERSLYQLGESSLFLINAREMSYLSAQGKYLELLSKTNKLALTELYTQGVLGK